MTSTYRPLFLGFFCPALRGAGAPSKSSILLALLMLVVGLLGGPLGGPAVRPGLDAERLKTGGARGPRLSWGDCGTRLGIDCGGPEGGGTLERPPAGGRVEVE